ncbi:MAG: acetoin utilization protein AcuC [Pseudomonadota bacterium]
MTSRGPIFLGNEIYRTSSYGRWHPLRIPRVSTVIDLSRACGWLTGANYRNSPRAKPRGLHLWHTPEYVAALRRAEDEQAVSAAVRARHRIGTTNNPIYPEMFRRPATAAGAALLAAAYLEEPGVVYSPAGGTHHGFPDRANGFCYFNDPVLAMTAMRQRGIGRIAYVDIDAHHCDGVEYAFADDPETLLISVHEENRWPRTGALSDRGVGNVFNLPVPRGLNDSEMAEITARLIEPQVSRFRPEALVLQCGADAVEEDPLSRLSLSNNAHVAVLDALYPLAPRLLVTGGGGYNPWSVGRLWTRVWGRLAGAETPDRLPPAAVAVLEALARDVPWQGRAPEPHWFDRLVDPPRPGPVRAEIRTRLDALGGVMA